MAPPASVAAAPRHSSPVGAAMAGATVGALVSRFCLAEMRGGETENPLVTVVVRDHSKRLTAREAGTLSREVLRRDGLPSSIGAC